MGREQTGRFGQGNQRPGASPDRPNRSDQGGQSPKRQDEDRERMRREEQGEPEEEEEES